jgi:hypothetical protein
MLKLNLPEFKYKIQSKNSKNYIFDIIRKKFVALTPEEYVRQNFIHFLIFEKNYPKEILGVEISIKINETDKRSDIILFGKNGNARLVVECKAPNININQKTFNQIAVYNINLKAEYLIVTNGITHFCCKFDDVGNYIYLKDIPDYSEL